VCIVFITTKTLIFKKQFYTMHCNSVKKLNLGVFYSSYLYFKKAHPEELKNQGRKLWKKLFEGISWMCLKIWLTIYFFKFLCRSLELFLNLLKKCSKFYKLIKILKSKINLNDLTLYARTYITFLTRHTSLHNIRKWFRKIQKNEYKHFVFFLPLFYCFHIFFCGE